MENILVVVDMQNDFIDGALGTKEAVAIVPNVCERIKTHNGPIYVTLDTHASDYMESYEGKNLPVPHCIKGTEGHKLNAEVEKALEGKDWIVVEKPTFGSMGLQRMIKAEYAYDVSIELVGLCTDICVVSNALILKAVFDENDISVVESCCAGVTPEKHKAAIETMKSCQIIIK